MGAISFSRPTGKESPEELADMVVSLQKTVEHLSRNINSKNITEIGRWIVDNDRLTSMDGDVGMSGAYSGLDDVRFWAGDTTPEIAPWRVHNSGKGVATGWTIQSREGSYPRVMIDPENDLFGAYQSPSQYITMGAMSYDLSETLTPYLAFVDGSSWAQFYFDWTGFALYSGGPFNISVPGVNFYSSYININEFSRVIDFTGTSLAHLFGELQVVSDDHGSRIAALESGLSDYATTSFVWGINNALQTQINSLSARVTALEGA
ncbi:hypothetical protein [Paenibacillus kobensis]|uniref:hypothetical protein n=1 Tax=Paenibacillus kobensis TaxID=59841 RepID=UPI000FDC326E|nr:hypothetical protein [Paenibacillus kobensis]